MYVAIYVIKFDNQKYPLAVASSVKQLNMYTLNTLFYKLVVVYRIKATLRY